MTRIWGVQVLPPNANRDNYIIYNYIYIYDYIYTYIILHNSVKKHVYYDYEKPRYDITVLRDFAMTDPF